MSKTQVRRTTRIRLLQLPVIRKSVGIYDRRKTAAVAMGTATAAYFIPAVPPAAGEMQVGGDCHSARITIKQQNKKEMTLDDSAFASFVKGHFCSVLLSNIIGYLHFYSVEQIPYRIWISLPFCIFLWLF